MHRITLLPQELEIAAPHGARLLDVLRSAGILLDAPCGGAGTCGKCRVNVDGKEVSACCTWVEGNMTVILPVVESMPVRKPCTSIAGENFALAFDIGTTTVAGYLLDGKSGQELAAVSRYNPQISFGADVISRIRYAVNGEMETLTGAIRKCVAEMVAEMTAAAGVAPSNVTVFSIVGNPAMQQLFFGVRPENLAKIPFAPVLTEARCVPAADLFPVYRNVDMLIVPDISGFVGADTVACVLATGIHNADTLTLMVDIGTNGEMVLGNRNAMVACSTAAGPALEGANIRCGMRGQIGAIDHVDADFRCSVIGGGEAEGICGSGLIDAIAAALDAGLLNRRGRILNEERVLKLTDRVFLTQEDIRQVQTAKGAIAAGIYQMAAHLGVQVTDIGQVYLAGAFGSFLNAGSACRIGLLPPELAGKIRAVGNAAGIGAKMLALDTELLKDAQGLTRRIGFIELADTPGFAKRFAKCMEFEV